MECSLITRAGDLPPELRASLREEETAYLETIAQGGNLPFGVTPHFASLAGTSQDDPIRRQFFPDPREALGDPFALEDPLGEALYRAAPRLVHQYRDRALLLAGGSCAGYCRYCFRRGWIARPQGFIPETVLIPILAYLRVHPEIREILISGGDPLTGSDESLAWLFQALRQARPGILLRICTRMPITEPSRLTSELLGLFQSYQPLRMAVHLNHPRELSEPTRKALAEAVQGGIPVHIQTVLLQGINDNAETLGELFRECLDLGLSPYYLFQLDLAQGTAHFRVPLKRGLALYQELQARISGLGLPKYAADLPGGGGKILLHPGAIGEIRHDPRGMVYVLKGQDGKERFYPAG